MTEEQLKQLEAQHCKDCCCARSWNALSVTEYTGKSIPEHITELIAEVRRLRKNLEYCAPIAKKALGESPIGKLALGEAP